MFGYFSNFVKTGDPNGGALPKWPAVGKGDDVMRIDVETRAQPDKTRARYLLLDELFAVRATSAPVR